MMHNHVAALRHPQLPACSKPTTDSPMPSATSLERHQHPSPS